MLFAVNKRGVGVLLDSNLDYVKHCNWIIDIKSHFVHSGGVSSLFIIIDLVTLEKLSILYWKDDLNSLG